MNLCFPVFSLDPITARDREKKRKENPQVCEGTQESEILIAYACEILNETCTHNNNNKALREGKEIPEEGESGKKCC